jgi:hypothetical protein
MLPISSDQDRARNRDRAEAVFRRKQERQRDGEQATAQYEADQRAMRDKTMRLRALRLAREAAHAAEKRSA